MKAVTMSARARGRMGAAAELLRKGATLLEEPCPKCGGIQLRYKGRVTCVSCGEPKTEEERAAVHKAELVGAVRTVSELRALLLSKVIGIGGELQREESSERQKELLSLLLSYLEALERVSKIAPEEGAEG